MPFTRCSSAGRSMSARRAGAGTGLLLRLAGGRLRLGLVGGAPVGPRGRDLQRLRSRQALELLPVTGLGQDRLDRLARLGADREPVLDALGVDLDPRGLLLRVVQADVLDRPAVALGARVGHHDAVLRVADLAHPQKPDAYGHCVLAPESSRLSRPGRHGGACGGSLNGLAACPGERAPGARRIPAAPAWSTADPGGSRTRCRRTGTYPPR